MRVLVTGGAGFVGSNIAKRCVADGYAVTVLDDFSSGEWRNLIEFQGDVLTLDLAGNVGALASAQPFQLIFHQASITDTTVMDQRRMMHNNLEGFRQLLDLAVKWQSRVVWASSAATYGRGASPNRESQPPAPLNVYGFSKLAMERLSQHYETRLKHPIVGLRYFNVYGAGEAHKGKFASMIHQLAKQMRAGKRPRIFTDGEQKRDFVYIDDVIHANLAAAQTNDSGIYNIGSGAAASFNEVVKELNRVLNTDLPPEYFPNPYDFFQTWTEAELSHAREGLCYDPKFDLTKGIDAYHASGALGI